MNTNIIHDFLKNNYLPASRIFCKFTYNIPEKFITRAGYVGSDEQVNITSPDSITHNAPECFAAPVITMVAKKAIELGVIQNSSSHRLTIFAPKALLLQADHISISSDIQLFQEPAIGKIFCKKLTIVRHKGENSSQNIELIKGWVQNKKATKIEIVNAK